jgi:hypothetical protein
MLDGNEGVVTAAGGVLAGVEVVPAATGGTGVDTAADC